ncbi:hypothetical protein JCM18909_3484 [Cutibacterium acnes JCM 18909]|nr:hypothetical protein JCM18909_3484 [Cutibacterium acnes JCM 18909]
MEAAIRPRDPIDPEASTTKIAQEAARPARTLARQSIGLTCTARSGRSVARRDF